MSLEWTYDKQFATENRDVVRFLIGDTIEEKPLLDDREIQYSLDTHVNVLIAAAVCCEAVAAKFSQKSDMRIGDISKKLGQVAKAYRTRANELRNQAALCAEPFFGGVLDSADDALLSDSDVNRTKFQLGRFDHPGASLDG